MSTKNRHTDNYVEYNNEDDNDFRSNKKKQSHRRKNVHTRKRTWNAKFSNRDESDDQYHK